MGSHLLTRFLPTNNPNNPSPSIYETIRQHDDSDASDVEERGAMAVDEENLGDHYADHELEDAMAMTSDTQSTHSSPFHQRSPNTKRNRESGSSRWKRRTSPRPTEVDEGDDEVPASLLIEGDPDGMAMPLPPPPPPPPMARHNRGDETHAPIPGPSTPKLRQKWKATSERQPLYRNTSSSSPPPPPPNPPPQVWNIKQRSALALVDPKEKAMWRWANVENLDNFLKEIYVYYLGNGIWCIVLSRLLNILTLAFVVGFTTFLTNCIDYRAVPHSKSLTEVRIPKCISKMPASATFLLWLFTIFLIGKAFQYVVDYRRLRQIQDFYQYLLGISDVNLQTISWQEVVSRIMTLRDANPATAAAISARHRRFLGSQSKQRMDAHDIANRIMRKENYLIALFNKDILDLTLPIPFLRKRQLFSRTLEWNLNLCIVDYVFNEQGQLRPLFLKDTHRKALSEGLRRRFIFAGVMNIFVAPFIVTYFLMHYFFRYFTEYQKKPSQIGSRQYTPLAEWKFREFNELWHLFERRINMSHLPASEYIDQFPKDKTIQLSRFVAFIASALASVLALASVIDPELFLGFEITHDRTVLFYLGIFGTVWAVAQGIVPAETLVFDPELALRQVIEFTHYRPAHWQGKLHSDEVRKEFSMLYQMKLVIFLEEILSMIFTPFVLWFSLPKCSDQLIDFVREFTVHVDGLGYVCSFAVFDFKKGNNMIGQGPEGPKGSAGTGTQDLRDDYYATKDGKMLASYYGFLDHYSTNPNPRSGAMQHHMPNRRYYYQQQQSQSRHGPPSPEDGFATGTNNYGRDGIDAWDFAQQRPTPRRNPNVGRTPRFEPTTGGNINSPVASILLDPHHQPSASGFRPGTRSLAQSRSRPSRQAHYPLQDTIKDVDETVEADEAGPSSHPQPNPQAGTSSGAVATDDSQMDESWRINLAGEVDDDEEHEEDIQNIAGNPGVLGLIHQFQKVSSEGRRAMDI